MSTLISWSDWVETGVGGDWNVNIGAPPSGTDRCLVFECVYVRTEGTFTPANLRSTFGTKTYAIKTDYKQQALSAHIVTQLWLEAQITTATDNLVRNNVDGTDNYYYRYGWFENVDQTDPFPDSTYTGYLGYDGGGSTVPFEANTVNGATGDYQWMTYLHTTGNRSYTLDADFDQGVDDYEKIISSENARYGWHQKKAGGETNYTLKQSIDDTNKTIVSLRQLKSTGTASPSITDVNGTDDVAEGNDIDTANPNIVNGFLLNDVDGVDIDGVVQDEFLNPDTGTTLQFSTSLALGLVYGPGKTLTLSDPVNGDITHTIGLVPASGRGYMTVAGLPWDPAERSIFDGHPEGAVSNGDVFDYDLTTNIGNTISMSADGVFLITSGNPNEAQWFTYMVHLAGIGWSNRRVVYVQTKATVYEVDGVVSGVGTVNINATNSVVKGINFGNIDPECYLMNVPGDGSEIELDGTEVSQSVVPGSLVKNGDGTDEVTVASWNIGNLSPAADYAVIIGPHKTE